MSTGRMTMSDLKMGFLPEAPELIGKLADSLGVPPGELIDMVERGEVQYEQIQDVLGSVTA